MRLGTIILIVTAIATAAVVSAQDIEPVSTSLLPTASVSTPASGAGDIGFMGIRLQFDRPGNTEETGTAIKIMVLMTLLSLSPSFLIMMTSFTCVLIVLGFLRQAIGSQSTPPTQVLTGLALFLTIFIMAPVWQKINTDAIRPYLDKSITQDEAIQRGVAPIRDFMLKQTGKEELSLFTELSGKPRPTSDKDLSLVVLTPAFMTSQLKMAFQLGFLVYLPFLVIDLVVSSSLMALGMMMLPPMMISLPIKLLFFVLADGWTLLIRNIVASYKM